MKELLGVIPYHLMSFEVSGNSKNIKTLKNVHHGRLYNAVYLHFDFGGS